MARALDIFLDQDMVVAKARRRLTPATGECIGKILWPLNQPHPLAAAASDCLDQHRIANAIGLDRQETRILVAAHIARGHWHTSLLHQLLGRIFQAHGGDTRRVGANPDKPCADHALRKFRIFREETIARVDRLSASRARGIDDLFTHQIAFARGRGPDMHGIISHTHMQRVGIGIRIDRNGADTHGACGADDPASNFATIGDEEGLDHLHYILNTPKPRSSTGAFSVAASASPSTSRDCAGSIIPSSHSRAVA